MLLLMRHHSAVLVIVFLSVLLSGCSILQSPVATPAGSADQKQGDTQLTGVISATSSGFLLTTDTLTIAIDSYALDLSAYLDQGPVTVTGQYSGDTLFIGSIE